MINRAKSDDSDSNFAFLVYMLGVSLLGMSPDAINKKNADRGSKLANEVREKNDSKTN